jgi:hypothetical protein
MGNAWKKHPNPARPSMRIADAFILLPQAEQDAYDAAERGEAPGAMQSLPKSPGASGVGSHGAEITNRLVRPASYP